MLVLVLCLIAFAVIVLHIVIPKRYNWPSVWKKINKIPGPPAIPYLGNTLQFCTSNEEFIPNLVKFANTYGPVWKMSIFGVPFVFLTDFDDIEVILSSRTHITKGVDYVFLQPWLGTGLLISTGKKWFDHRKLLTPAFHFSILENYLDIMNKNAITLGNILQSYDKGFPVEINPLISNCALDIICGMEVVCETAMGVEVNAQLGGEKEYVKGVIRMSQIFTERTLTPWLYRPCLFNISPLGREHNRILKVVHGFTQKVIKERQMVFRKNKNSEKDSKSENFDAEGKKKMSFLDILIQISQTENQLTEEEIREEVDTFMFEGHDTTAAAMTWALFELGLHPEIQEKAYKEQCEIFQGRDRRITFSDLQEMKYLERIIKETLRLFPSVPIISRKLDQDVKIRNYEIPAETEMPIFIYYIHRNEEIYPEPEKFDPDRFLPDQMRDRHPFSYIPFSAGPRNCIGQKFAMLEEKIVLSHLIRKFKIISVDKLEDIQVMGEVILRPKKNLKMRFEKRTM